MTISSFESMALSAKASGAKNIILDLDGTLIDSQFEAGARAALVVGAPFPKHICGKNLSGLHIYKRPGLDNFLAWCFKNFNSVGLWSLSGEEWANEFFLHVVPEFARNKWSFVWTGERATRLISTKDKSKEDFVSLNGRPVLKDLKKIFRQKRMKEKGIFKNNTIIVEDTPSNCMRQYGNAIFVKPFDVCVGGPDSVLSDLQKYLAFKVLGAEDVRVIDKRNWNAEVKEEEKKLAEVVKPKTSFWMGDNWKTCITQRFQDKVLKVTSTYPKM